MTYALLPESYLDAQAQHVPLTHAGRATAGLAVWMAVWWMTQAIPVSATACLPLVVLPVAGASSIHAAAAPYGHELIFLFMGGFILGLAIGRWGLDKRTALATLRMVGARPHRIVGGVMLVTAGLSMFISNTATSVMMLPIALSVIELLRRTGGDTPEVRGRHFALCMLLGIAYAASIGGIGTLVGTPTNAFLAAFVSRTFENEISFVRWLGVGLPLVVIFLPLTWWLLTRLLHPIPRRPIEGAAELSRQALSQLGPLNRGERVTLVVFLIAAFLWIFRTLLARIELGGLQPFAGLTDPGIAMLAALLLFVIPVDVKERVFAMDWETARQLPWGILILFGGGLSLATAIDDHGVAEFLGAQVGGLGGLPAPVLMLLVTALMIFLTELSSNTAATAAMVPVLAALAPGLGLHPYALIVPAAIAASCAFMLPVATPPNAVVFGSGEVSVPEMARAGVWLNLIGVGLITAICYLVALPLLGASR